MAKRAPSSSSAGTPAVKKAKVVTKQEVVTEKKKKKPVTTTSGKKANVKVEPKANVKVEPKANVKVEPKANVKVEPKAGGSGGRKSTQPAAVASTSKASASKTKSAVIIKEVINVKGKVKVKEEPTDESIMSAASASTSKARTSKTRTSKPKKPQLKAKSEEKEAANQVIKADVYDEELNEFTVERILDKDIFEDGIPKYKVKWLGYSMKQCTWESVHNLANSMRHVLRWERDNPNWKLAPLPRAIDNAKRNMAIRREYIHLTLGGYRIMEKYGQVNKHTWFLVAREEDVDDKTDEEMAEEVQEVNVAKVEKVLCLADGDPYYNHIGTIKEYVHVMRAGAWDDRLDFEEDEDEE